MSKGKLLPKPKQAAAEGSNTAPIARIAKLEKALLSEDDPNPLLDLLALSRHGEAEVVHKAIWALHRVFVAYIQNDRVTLSLTNGEDKEGEVKGWIKARLIEYIELLGGLLHSEEAALRTSAVKLLFSLLPPFSSKVSTATPTVHLTYFRLILPHLTSELPSDTLGEIVDFWAKYDDLRYLFFREAAASPSEHILAQLVALDNLPKIAEDINAFYIPSLSTAPSDGAPAKKKSKGKDRELDAAQDWLAYYDSPSSDEESGANHAVAGAGKKRKRVAALSIHASIHSIPAHQTAYSKLWESIFSSLPLSPPWVRRILVGLHGPRGILANLKVERRVRFADWLGSLVDGGEAEAILAMNGLYVLMTEYNLDYPKFYPRLYTLLDKEVLHSPYRARFFRLLHTFLGSPLLPAALVAGFIKRLARRSLTAPPAGILIVIPFVYNLLKRHPGTMVMLQRHAPDATDGEDAAYKDPYDPEEPSPANSKAIDSSLWEIKALQSHYLASVSTMAKIFSETFTKPEFGLEDFLDHGYATLFETELKRKIKHAPALSMSLELDAGGAEPFPKNEVDGIWAW